MRTQHCGTNDNAVMVPSSWVSERVANHEREKNEETPAIAEAKSSREPNHATVFR
jgi:hypothetical protein